MCCIYKEKISWGIYIVHIAKFGSVLVNLCVFLFQWNRLFMKFECGNFVIYLQQSCAEYIVNKLLHLQTSLWYICGIT